MFLKKSTPLFLLSARGFERRNRQIHVRTFGGTFSRQKESVTRQVQAELLLACREKMSACEHRCVKPVGDAVKPVKPLSAITKLRFVAIYVLCTWNDRSQLLGSSRIPTQVSSRGTQRLNMQQTTGLLVVYRVGASFAYGDRLRSVVQIEAGVCRLYILVGQQS